MPSTLPVLDENRSIWVDEAGSDGPPPASPLHGVHDCDVVIIGGGFTGLSTAWHLNQRFPERRIMLLEARRVANGASGRNGGQALTGINGVEPRDPERARRIYDQTRSGIDLIEELVDRYGLDAGFGRHGSLEVYTSARTADAAASRVERLRAMDLPFEWVEGTHAGISGAHGAIRDPAGARVNGVALLRGLHGVLASRGVEVIENTAAESIEEGATIRVRTAQAEVRAGAVVLATNAYTPSLGYFKQGILPLHSQVLATEVVPDSVWSSLCWSGHDSFADDMDRIAYGSRTAAGRLLFGGGGNSAYHYRYGGNPVFRGDSASARRGFAGLEAKLHGYFPGLAGVGIARRWTGTLALTLDRVCSMGVQGTHANVYYALGYSGHGVALAMLAGRVLCDLYSDDHTPWADLPFYQRRLSRIPPEPFRWLGYQLYTRSTGRSPRRVS